MTSAPATRPERVPVLTDVQGRTFWRCPNCGRTLAEVIGTQIIVKTGDRVIRVTRANPVEQVCPKCGETSTIEAA